MMWISPPKPNHAWKVGGRDRARRRAGFHALPGGVALRFARMKGYRLDKNPEEADTITSLRALLPARAGDEFQASGPSKEVPNP
jgi:hypothetical protein